MTERVTTEIDGPVAIITMDDGKVNALSESMQDEITHHLLEAEQYADVKAIALVGRPGVFSAGFDLGVMGSGDMNAIISMVASGGEFVRRIYGLSLPAVAAATGHAIAAGAFILLACDVRVGPDADIKIGMNEVAIGMAVPEWAITIASHRLANQHLNRSLLTARLTGGAEAVDVGFLDEVVAADVVVSAAVARAHALAELDAGAYVEMVKRYRGAVLAKMESEIAADRTQLSRSP